VNPRVQKAITSSALLAGARLLCRESRVCAFARRTGRSFSGRLSWIGSRIAAVPATCQFPHATRTAVTSRLLAWIDGLLLVTAEATGSSKTRRLVTDGIIAPLEVWQRVRLLGVIVVVAAGVSAALSVVASPVGWPAVRWAVWLVITVTGLWITWAPRAIASAWKRRHRATARDVDA